MASLDVVFRVVDLPKNLSVSISEVKKQIGETLSSLGKDDVLEKGFIDVFIDLLQQGLCSYEITKELRVAGYDIGLGEILEIIEQLRGKGFLRFVGVKSPDRFERAELVAIIPDFEVKEVDIKEVLEEADLGKLREEVESLLSSETEGGEVMPTPPSYAFQEVEEQRREEIRSLAKDLSENLRVILEPQIALSPHIKHIVIATRDGLPVIQINKKGEQALEEEQIAAAISVVVAQSFQTAFRVNKKGFNNVLIRTDKAIIISGYIDSSSSYILTTIMDLNTPMGLIYSDFNSMKKLLVSELEKSSR